VSGSPKRKTNGRLRSRAEALVEEFYRGLPLEPVATLEPGTTPKEQELSLASGITDRAVLRLLADLEVSSSVVAALALVPLVEVAWADGELAPEERAAVLRASEEQGIRPGSRAHGLLASWMERPPTRGLFEAWEAYIEAVLEPLLPDERERLCTDLAGRARDIARAAGQRGGPGGISAEEERALERLEAALRFARER
jgi:tellurite resistance protein